MAATPGDALVRNVVAFGRLLRSDGVAAGPERVRTALESLGTIDVTVREDAYWALRAALVSRREEIETFDDAFERFWDRVDQDAAPPVPEPVADADGREGAAGEARSVEAGDDDEDGEPDDGEPDDARLGVAWSADERLAELDFREYGPDELAQAERIVGRIALSLPRRRSRRLEPARSGPVLDRRRTLRLAMATGGHAVQRSWRRARTVVRKLVFIIDVSGSMEAYARPMVMFLHAAVRAHPKVEGFSFGTRLTRLTPHLTARDADDGMRRAARAVPDWAGGTRIGENLRAFNELWGRRGVTRGATVVIVSDGWERGDVGLLAEEMKRLHRAAYRVVWVNPLAGDPDYEPLAAGMSAALPSIDVFLPGHNLRSLEALADVLEALPAHRTGGGVPAGARGGQRASRR